MFPKLIFRGIFFYMKPPPPPKETDNPRVEDAATRATLNQLREFGEDNGHVITQCGRVQPCGPVALEYATGPHS